MDVIVEVNASGVVLVEEVHVGVVRKIVVEGRACEVDVDGLHVVLVDMDRLVDENVTAELKALENEENDEDVDESVIEGYRVLDELEVSVEKVDVIV